MDADSFPVKNPEFLFDHPAYKETGALFWPDIGVTTNENSIWEEMGVAYRLEPEFESGQMLIDTVRHREPFELALQMNIAAEKYYQMIWGDNDTFRFAFHKYGRPFAMIPHPLQLLALPQRPYGDLGVMCQHDFEGRRLFQHRNMAKWDLLGGTWLVEDHRPRSRGCCGPPEKWMEKRVSKPWLKERTLEEERSAVAAAAAMADGPSATADAVAAQAVDTPMQTVPALAGAAATHDNGADEAAGSAQPLIPLQMPGAWKVGRTFVAQC